MKSIKAMVVVAGVLTFATSAMAAAALEPILYEDGVNDVATRWTAVPGLGDLVYDPTNWKGHVGFNGGSGGSFNLKAHVLGYDLGDYNDLHDGSHFSDPLAANEAFKGVDGHPLTLETWYTTYSSFISKDVNWQMAFSGDDHTIVMGSGTPNNSNNLFYSIDGGPWTNSGLLLDTTLGSNSPDFINIRMAIRSSSLEFSTEVPDVHPKVSVSVPVPPDFSDFSFHTVTITNQAASSARVGLVSQVNVLGEFDYNVVPEPATLALLGLGGLVMLRRRRA